MESETTPGRRRRSDGERSRRAILMTAARLATVEGLDGLTIGRLATATGMSKSGLFAHFGSKEELQLATIATAEEIFQEDVLAPSLEVEGVARVERLCESFLSHVGRDVFPGGCFFASALAELDTRPGRVRERVVAVQRAWTALIEDALATARERGEIDADADPAQLTFEINAMLAEANGLHLVERDPRWFDMARRAIADRLDRVAVAAP
ncbi:TetR/AcrR family transcriptional regulator [Miltoncostaea oceani]|uniref:TetR/AcrR family transcriptional regulator n=1 Tax=Miltoncostaea oceani TaxID=2843216 RepID=UPI001C3C84C1|nr:TetR/AcrR family transcriptional regulator [Miltoncostaea oceani]